MGIFDFLKKTETSETTETTNEVVEPSGKTCLGVLGLFPIKETNELLIIGSLEGGLKVGDCLQFSNPDQGMDALGSVVVKKLINQNKDVDVLTDDSLAHLVIDMESSLANLKKGSVLYSQGVDEEQRLSSYTDALYNTFVIVQKGQMSNEDYQAASLDDSIEILRLFLWECRQNQETES